jgi:serine/threonine protein kinase
MVIEKVTSTIYDYVLSRKGQPVRVETALVLMAAVIQGLSLMHDRGVIHGDIHAGNVVMLGEKTVGFIDFGNAFFSEELIGANPRIAGHLEQVHCFYSPYDIEGYRFSYRDDVYKAVWLGAFLLGGLPQQTYFNELSNQGRAEEVYNFKKFGDMFVYPGGPDRIQQLQNVTEEAKSRIKFHLARVAEKVRSIDDIMERPDYFGIIAELRAAATLVPRGQ